MHLRLPPRRDRSGRTMMHDDTSFIRPPAVAGMFYPDQRAALRRWIDQAMDEAMRDAQPSGVQVRALIAPHAGYIYSGRVAASAYARLRGRSDIQRVVIVGPSHRVHLHGLGLSTARAFATPLGDVPLDDAAHAPLRGLAFVHDHDEAHGPEHGLEVQLPFLQCVLPAFTCVPIVMGEISAHEVRQALKLLADDRTLIIISSDLSHYHEDEVARIMDSATSRAIEALRPEDISPDQACGRAGIQALLLLAQNRGWRARTVDQRHSGDAGGPRDRVVGYGAYVFTAEAEP